MHFVYPTVDYNQYVSCIYSCDNIIDRHLTVWLEFASAISTNQVAFRVAHSELNCDILNHTHAADTMVEAATHAGFHIHHLLVQADKKDHYKQNYRSGDWKAGKFH